MSGPWEALCARARGLGARLLDEERLSGLSHVSTVTDLVRGLSGTPYEPHLPTHATGPGLVEVGITRSLAERMSTLVRWAGPDGDLLRPVVLEQDVRNVRMILRAALGELPVEFRAAVVLVLVKWRAWVSRLVHWDDLPMQLHQSR